MVAPSIMYFSLPLLVAGTKNYETETTDKKYYLPFQDFLNKAKLVLDFFFGGGGGKKGKYLGQKSMHCCLQAEFCVLRAPYKNGEGEMQKWF